MSHHSLSATNVTSPVSASRSLCESPQPKKGGGGGVNLTGIPRKVKDNCAEIHNLIQRWNVHQIHGHNLLREITNIRQNHHIQSSENGGQEVGTGEAAIVDRRTLTFSVDLQRTCEELLQTVEELSLIHKKMRQMTSQFESLVALENLQNSFTHLQNEPESKEGSDSFQSNASIPVFHTWTMVDYEETSRTVTESYELDLKLKRDIADVVAHVQSSDAALFLLSAWSHQPHVTDRVRLRLEAMLTESGHRYRLQK